ncbi:cytochrome P450 [Nocardia brevicatena]|uniref:cytochrome P450 n=1 Tax=Nocardia brevicatena TaxID=37327 RepID=UPI001FE0EC7C|nr:cytochrome P450 [Nocardia brevicatena]
MSASTADLSSSIPLAPGSLPVLGHAVAMLRNPTQFLSRLPECGDLVEIRLGPAKAIVVCTPQLTHQVLHDDRTFAKGGPFFERVREAVGDGVASCAYDKHRRQRRLLQPAFHHTRIPGYAHRMEAAIVEVTGSWRNGSVIDVLGDMSTIAANSVAAALFSEGLSRSALRQVSSDVQTVMAGFYRRMFMPSLLRDLPIRSNRRYEIARARLRRALAEIIADRRAADRSYDDLLSAMVAARDHHEALSDTEIIDNITTFFIAGIATAASAMAWAVSHVANHPGIEQQLHEEIDTVLAGRAATHDDLPRLDLTRRILLETLRDTPPAWILTRAATVDTELNGYTITAGTTIVYSPYLIHHRADLYPNPDRFDPERWLPSSNAPGPMHDPFVPFASGPRKCIGDNFVMTEATLALATIAARWRLQTLPGDKVGTTVSTELRPRKLRLRTVAR